MEVGNTGVTYWDMYFILKMLPIPEEKTHIDVEFGTRDFLVITVMKRSRHLYVSEYEGYIDAIASTKQGINFYNYLVRIGFGKIQTESNGKKIIKEQVGDFNKNKQRYLEILSNF